VNIFLMKNIKHVVAPPIFIKIMFGFFMRNKKIKVGDTFVRTNNILRKNIYCN